MPDSNTCKRNVFDKRRFWRVHIEAWQKCGLSQNEYCRRNEISNGQFCYWKRVLKNNPGKSFSAFVPVPIPSGQGRQFQHGQDSGLTILLGNGLRIRLSREFDAPTLVKVTAALGLVS